MNAVRISVALCGALALVGSVSADEKADRLVEQVQARFDATRDLRADVAQEVAVLSLGRSVSTTGKVIFKRPGKMRWELRGDESQIIVADGETIWFYQPEDEQVLKAPVRSAFRSSTPVSFLTGVGKIADDFTASLEGESDGRIDLLLLPKRASEIGRLVLSVDAESHDIVAAKVTDPLGNVTDLRFTNLQRNTDVAESQFTFEVPEGVDVVEAPIGY